MRVLVTGATGFLGGAVVDALLEASHRVRALVRTSSNTTALEAKDVELIVGSLLPPRALDEAVAGMDAVIHCAGGGLTTSRAALYENNTGTLQSLVDAMTSETRPMRLVFVSSVAARGPNGTPITHYGRAKAQADEVALALPATIHVSVLRPPAIYGPGDDRMLPLYRGAARGWLPIPGPSETTSLIHVRDCASAITALLAGDHASGRTFYVEDGEVHRVDQMARQIADAVGRKARIFRVPLPILWFAAAIAEVVGRIRGKAALLTFDKVRDLSQRHWECDAGPLIEAVDWVPTIRFEDGVRETASWYQEHGRL